MKPVIKEVMIPLFSFLVFEKFGSIKDISFKILCTVWLYEEVSYKNLQMVLFSHKYP